MPGFRERYPAPEASEHSVETAELRRIIKDKIAELTKEVNTADLKIIDMNILRQILGRVEQFCDLPKGTTLPPIDLSNHLTFIELIDRVEKTDEAAAELLEQAVLGSKNVISFERRKHRATAEKDLESITESDVDDAFDGIQTGS